MKNKRRPKGSVLIAGGILLLVAAAGFLGYNLWDEQRAAESVAAAVEELKADLPAQPEYLLYPDAEMPVKTVDGQDYIGLLEIPSQGLELPIISQWSYPALRVSPCRYEGSAYDDSLILAAHNYASHFRCLNDLVPGEEIRFTDVDGNVFRYEVILRETLEPTAIEEMKSDEWDLTLFTCTLGGQYRVTVRCERME